ncbi:hypothetical protein DH2020_009782 [Rehmannia glutinosa]|uniref:Uncharacterized protein n=1 Tax=Rehmannia glutinosa TaxID=99300 RepID=A0ABR0X9M4_REHGL
MAAAIDMYDSVFCTDPFREELMQALQPFMKSASSSSTAFSPSPSFPSSISPSFSCDSNMLNFPHLRHQLCLESSNFKPLQSSVDAKLEAICQNLEKSQKQGKSEKKPCLVSDEKSELLTEKCVLKAEIEVVKVEDASISSSTSPAQSDEASSSMAGSASPESDMTFLDFSEPSFDEFDNFLLEKYPSVEIDWAAL